MRIYRRTWDEMQQIAAYLREYRPQPGEMMTTGYRDAKSQYAQLEDLCDDLSFGSIDKLYRVFGDSDIPTDDNPNSPRALLRKIQAVLNPIAAAGTDGQKYLVFDTVNYPVPAGSPELNRIVFNAILQNCGVLVGQEQIKAVIDLIIAENDCSIPLEYPMILQRH